MPIPPFRNSRNAPRFEFTPDLQHHLMVSAAGAIRPAIEQATQLPLTVPQILAMNWAGWTVELADGADLAKARWIIKDQSGTPLSQEKVREFLSASQQGYHALLKPANG